MCSLPGFADCTFFWVGTGAHGLLVGRVFQVYLVWISNSNRIWKKIYEKNVQRCWDDIWYVLCLKSKGACFDNFFSLSNRLEQSMPHSSPDKTRLIKPLPHPLYYWFANQKARVMSPDSAATKTTNTKLSRIRNNLPHTGLFYSISKLYLFNFVWRVPG